MPVPEILLVAPPPIQPAKGPIAPKFVGAEEKAVGLSEAMREVASSTECRFFDAGSVTSTSAVDGVHLDEQQHQRLGAAIAAEVAAILD